MVRVRTERKHSKSRREYLIKDTDPSKFAVGTIVLKKDFCRKRRKGGCLDRRWIGPYKIVKRMLERLLLHSKC